MVFGMTSILEESGKGAAAVDEGAGFGGPWKMHVFAVFRRRPLLPVLQ